MFKKTQYRKIKKRSQNWSTFSTSYNPLILRRFHNKNIQCAWHLNVNLNYFFGHVFDVDFWKSWKPWYVKEGAFRRKILMLTFQSENISYNKSFKKLLFHALKLNGLLKGLHFIQVKVLRMSTTSHGLVVRA